MHLDDWIRRKIRVIQLKQRKRRYTMFYRSRGVTERMPGWEYWAVKGGGSRTPQSHMAMNMAWFYEISLISVTARWQELKLAAGNRLGAEYACRVV